MKNYKETLVKLIGEYPEVFSLLEEILYVGGTKYDSYSWRTDNLYALMSHSEFQIIRNDFFPIYIISRSDLKELLNTFSLNKGQFQEIIKFI